jgi:hypothetical protein
VEKRNLKIYSRLLLLSSFFFIISACSQNPKEETSKVNQKDTKMHKKELRHVVLFKFKETATAEDIAKVEEAFTALPSQIPEINSIEWGMNNSPEGLNKGFTHCFLLTFDSEEERSVYLPHPAHKAFGELLTPYLDDVFVIDYWPQE